MSQEESSFHNNSVDQEKDIRNEQFVQSYQKISELFESMRPREEYFGKKFKNIKRELDLEEVWEYEETIEQLASGLESDDTFDEAFQTLRKILDFVYYYGKGKNESHTEIEEYALKAIAKYLPTLELHLTEEDVGHSGKIIEMIIHLKKSMDDSVRGLVNPTLFRNKQIIQKGISNSDERSSYETATRIMLESPSDLQDEAVQMVTKGLMEGDLLYQAAFMSDLLSSGTLRQRVASEEIVSQILQERYGLDGIRFIYEWLETSGNNKDSRRHNLHGNIRGIEKLEEKFPGASKELYERFGIVNFGRWPEKMLEDQYEKRDDNKSPHGVIIFPRADWNGAFHDKIFPLMDLREQIEGKYNLRVYECGSKLELGQALHKAYQEYGEISFVLLGGHGSESSIQLGNKRRGGAIFPSDILHWDKVARSYTDQIKGRVRQLSELFIDNPTIILSSCSTAAGKEGGIALKISKLGATVIGPDKTSSLGDIYLENSEQAKFFVRYGHNAQPRIFKNGIEITEQY